MLRKIWSYFQPDQHTWQIAFRFLKEFWLPFIIAVGLTYYGKSRAAEEYDVLDKGIVNFFAAGWAFSQWNRIKKQKKNEDGISDVNKNTLSIINQLNRTTSDLQGAATGGDSFCLVSPMELYALDPSTLVVEHIGEFPLFDVNIRIVDLESYETNGASCMFDNQFSFNVLIPHHVTTVRLKNGPENLRLDEVRRYNIFFTARNGSFTQYLEIKYFEGKIAYAIRVSRNDFELFEVRSKQYPIEERDSIDWSAHSAV